jgi:iron(III) transport system permease protein
VILTLPCLLAHALNRLGPGARRRPATAEPVVLTRPLPAWTRLTLLAIAGAATVLVAGLAAVVAVASVTDAGGGYLTLRHYGALLSPAGAYPLVTSLELAALAGVLGSALAVGVGWVVGRHPSIAARVIEGLSVMPAALPGPVVGLGVLIAFGDPPVSLAGTLWILVVSVVFWKLPGAADEVVRRLRAVDPALEEAARSLGAGRVRTFAKVTLPSLAAIMAGVLGRFLVDGLLTVGTVAFLAPPETGPATVAMLGLIGRGDLGAASALAAVIIAIAAVVAVARRRSGGGGGLRRLLIQSEAPQTG